MAIKINDKELQEMLEMKNRGITTKEISEKFGVSRTTVTRRLKNVIDIKPKTRISEKVIESVFSDYKKGVKISELTSKYNYSRSTIKSILSRKGVIVNKKYEHLISDFVKDYQDGLSIREIGEIYNINHQTIAEYLYASGVDIRPALNLSRKYDIDHNYFKELNDEKIYKLGLIFSIGTISNRKHGSDALDLAITKKHLNTILESVEGISTRTKRDIYETSEGICKMSVISQELSDDLRKFGVKNKFPEFEDIRIQKIFFDAYFRCSTSIRPTGIYLSYNRIEKQGLLDYLEKIGINKDTFNNEKSGVFLMQNDTVERLVREHMFLLELIEDYCKINGWSSKWSNFIVRFREVLL